MWLEEKQKEEEYEEREKKGSEEEEEECARLPTPKGNPHEASEDLEEIEDFFLFCKVEEGDPPTAIQGEIPIN